jgi:hypothetical protein
MKGHRFNKSRSNHVSTGQPPYMVYEQPIRSNRNNYASQNLPGPNVHTVNITINQYADSKPIEEELISKMINESLKNIVKLKESSSNDK